MSDGLPAADSVLTLCGVLERLATDEIDDAADRLALVANALGKPDAATWRLAVRALQLDALVEHKAGDLADRSRDVARQAAAGAPMPSRPCSGSRQGSGAV